MNLYVSNLSFQVTEESLNEMFSKYGKVNSVKIILDRETQRSRGFAFVEMSSEAEGKEALSALNNKEVEGRMMNVEWKVIHSAFIILPSALRRRA